MFKKPEFIFTIFAFIFGLIILFITPKFGVADEPAHYARAKEVSQGVFYNNLPESRNDNYVFHGASGYSPVMYAFSGAGLKLTQNFDENIQFYTGRIINLIVWILLIALAIHITPVFKWAFFVTALLPMSIFEGMSYSADSFSNAFAFLYFAYMFKLIFNDKAFSNKKDIPLLVFFSITGALCKGIILPLLLVLFIPIKNHKFLIFIGLMLIALSTSFLWSHNNFIALAMNVDYSFNKSFILHQPIKFMQILTKTYIHNGLHLYGQALAKLGWQRITLANKLYPLMTFTLLSSVLLLPEKFHINWKHRCVGLIIFTIYTLTLSCLMFCMCNTPSDPRIVGLQGRYFLSMFPALFLVFGTNQYNNRYKNLVKIYLMVFCFVLLCLTCCKLYEVLQVGAQFFF